MLTPKFLGVLLLIASFATYLLSRYLESKLTLFNSCMLFLFGGAACYRMKSNPTTLKGKYIFITGCDTGIGHALCISLCKLEVNVFAGFLNAKSKAAEELKDKFSQFCHILQVDVSKDEDVSEAYDYISKELGENCLWGVVNNAGIGLNGPIEFTTMKQFENVMNINFFGLVRVTKCFLPLLREGRGRLLNVSSVRARCAWPFNGAYNATKSAVEAFSDTLRREITNFDVKVIIIEPGHYGGATQSLLGKDRIHKDLEDMWNESSEDVKSTFGRSYLETFENSIDRFAATSAQSLDYLIDGFIEALITTNPKDRYAIGGGRNIWFDPHKLQMLIFEYLPPSLVDVWIDFYDGPNFPTPQCLKI